MLNAFFKSVVLWIRFTPSDRLCLCVFSCGQEEPTYSALWEDNKAFNEVIISPAMLNEHMPHMVMKGLNKVRFSCVHAHGFIFISFIFASGCF